MNDTVREILDKLRKHITNRMKPMDQENDHWEADNIIQDLLSELDPEIAQLFGERRNDWYYS